MAYRKNGVAAVPYCFRCQKPLWNMSRARKHCKNMGHSIFRRWLIKRGQFPRKGSNAGEKNGTHKLTWLKVKEIRAMYRRGFSTYEMARIYRVSQNAVWLCVAGKTWNSSVNAI